MSDDPVGALIRVPKYDICMLDTDMCIHICVVRKLIPTDVYAHVDAQGMCTCLAKLQDTDI